ncbi:MAG: hypothetical protein U0Y82_07025 [Thermoleophilia bacterium]
MKRIVVTGVDANGLRFAADVAALLGPALPDVSVSTPDLRIEHVDLRADGAILCITRTGLATDDVFLLTGALHGAIGERAPLVPLLLDMTPDDISLTPLGLFQAATVHRVDMRALAAELGSPLDDQAMDQSWDAFYEATRRIPGLLPPDITVSLGVQSRFFNFRFRANSDGSNDNALWADTIGRILPTLPDSPLKVPSFALETLAALDVDLSRWIETPALLSRAPPHIGLLDESLRTKFRADPRLLARRLRDGLPTNGVMDTFFVTGDNMVFAPQSR